MQVEPTTEQEVAAYMKSVAMANAKLAGGSGSLPAAFRHTTRLRGRMEQSLIEHDRMEMAELDAILLSTMPKPRLADGATVDDADDDGGLSPVHDDALVAMDGGVDAPASPAMGGGGGGGGTGLSRPPLHDGAAGAARRAGPTAPRAAGAHETAAEVHMKRSGSNRRDGASATTASSPSPSPEVDGVSLSTLDAPSMLTGGSVHSHSQRAGKAARRRAARTLADSVGGSPAGSVASSQRRDAGSVGSPDAGSVLSPEASSVLSPDSVGSAFDISPDRSDYTIGNILDVPTEH
jgi:hypothetical protein